MITLNYENNHITGMLTVHNFYRLVAEKGYR